MLSFYNIFGFASQIVLFVVIQAPAEVRPGSDAFSRLYLSEDSDSLEVEDHVFVPGIPGVAVGMIRRSTRCCDIRLGRYVWYEVCVCWMISRAD